nr:unnamed protein product [Digitaria exilis]
MVARYAPPISYNFLNLIRLGGDAKTTFEKRDLGLNRDTMWVENTVEMKSGATSSRTDGRAVHSKYANNRENIASKYTSVREQNRQAGKAVKKEISSNSVSLLEERSSEQRTNTGVSPTGVSATWASMKIGFQNFKANMGSKKFIPLRQDLVPNSNASSPESLDDIFQKLKRRPANMPVDYLDDDDDDNTGDMDLHFQD